MGFYRVNEYSKWGNSIKAGFQLDENEISFQFDGGHCRESFILIVLLNIHFFLTAPDALK
jgi:hypothetical protein